MNIKQTILTAIIAISSVGYTQQEKIVNQEIIYTNKVSSGLKSVNTAPERGIVKNIIVNKTDKQILAGWINRDGKLSFPEPTQENPKGCIVEPNSSRTGHSMFGHVHVFADTKTNIIGYWISDRNINSQTFQVIINSK